ncbi:NXPE family member 3-like [Saccoglossus kowalevskii]|uniref:NXPE family member 2-like n=1 Tax=Saccoglossus kowalevskii TaxID=10224 RepID=A0ABM0MHN4_SACKO|nr:PREDICTED: NXPE family member 2-like [Saccoglossus kowalevskii]
MTTKRFAVLLAILTLLVVGSIPVFLDVLPTMKFSVVSIKTTTKQYWSHGVQKGNQVTVETETHTWNVSTGFIGSRGQTSALKTDVIFLSDDNSTFQGDIITLRLHARDDNGRRRYLGGDLWRAAIYNATSRFGSMGKVIDHDNGTYTVHFYAGFSGQVVVQIMLVLQREAIKHQQLIFLPMEFRGYWTGIFKSDGKTENSICFMQREGHWKDMCEYPHPRALGNTVFLCRPPKSLGCNTLAGISASRHSGDGNNKLRTNRTYQFKIPNAPRVIKGFNDRLLIQSSVKSGIITYSVPRCESDLLEPLVTGYWLGMRWYSLVCRNREWNHAKEVQKCLQDKDVYFIGDSTTRQWYQQMLDIAGYPINATDDNWRKRVNTIPGDYNVSGEDAYDMMVTDLKNNVNFTFHHHALSLHGFVPISRFPFSIDVLDELTAPKCNYVIVISLWAHFDFWTTDSYTERLSMIAKGIQHLRGRCPNTVIAIKGSHVRNSMLNYWIYYDMNRIMKDVFRGHGVFFIDIWDMNFAFVAAHQGTMTIHMPMTLIKEEVYMFLSHACLK